MDRLDDINYVSKVSPFTAVKDHIIGIINGHPAALSAIHINLLLKKYTGNLDLEVLSSRLSLFLKNVEVKGFDYQTKFYPLWGKYLRSLDSVIRHSTNEQMLNDKMEVEKLLAQFSKLIRSIITVHQLLLDENMATVGASIEDFAHHRDKTIKNLSAFLQADKNIDDKWFFFRMFATLIPSHPDIEEIKSLICESRDFYKEALSFFPGELKMAISQPELFKTSNSYKARYVSDSVSERARQIIYENGQNVSIKHRSIMNNICKCLLIIFLIFLVLTPVISMFIDYNTIKTVILNNSSADFGQDIAVQCYNMLIQQIPGILFRGTPEHIYWKEFSEEVHVYRNIIRSRTIQELIAEFTYGLPSNQTTENHRTSGVFTGDLSHEEYYSFLGGTFPLSYALQLLGLFSNAFVINDTAILSELEIGNPEYYYSFIEYVILLMDNLIEATKLARNNLKLDYILIIIFIILSIIGMILICYFIDTEEKRMLLFIESLRETSKSEMVRSRNFLKELEGNIGAITMNRKFRLSCSLNFYPVFVCAIIMVGLIVAYMIVMHCIILTTESHIIYKDTITDVHINMGKNVFKKIINGSIETFIVNTSELVANRHNSFCVPRYLHDTLSHQFNSTLFKEEIVSMSSINHINAFMSYISINSVTGLDVVYKYMSEIKKVMTYIRQNVIDKNSEHSNELEDIVFTISVIYIIIVIILAIYLFGIAIKTYVTE